MSLLKARRELRDRNTRLEALQTKYTTLERVSINTANTDACVV